MSLHAERAPGDRETVKVFVRKPAGDDDARVLSFRIPDGLKDYFILEAQELWSRGIALDGNQYIWTVERAEPPLPGYVAPWSGETRGSLSAALAADETAVLRFFHEHGYSVLVC